MSCNASCKCNFAQFKRFIYMYKTDNTKVKGYICMYRLVPSRSVFSCLVTRELADNSRAVGEGIIGQFKGY